MAIQDSESQNANARSPNERDPLLGPQGQAVQNEENSAVEEVANQTPRVKTPSTPKLFIIMGSLNLASFVAALDLTIVATLSGPISASFDSFTLLAWVASGYIIASAAIQPISGKVTDIYGRRAGLIFAFTFFSMGNLICGLAQKEWVIILGRVVAGAGGGCINTVTSFITTDLIPLRRRGVWQGIGNISWGLGAASGGFFGGAINDSLGWRWAFLIQVPVLVVVGLVACWVVRIPVKETDTSKIKRVDFLGALLLISSLVLFLLALNSGGNVVPWNHPLIYACVPTAALLLLLFIYVEERIVPEPVIPVRLMLNRTVAASAFVNWFLSITSFAMLYYVPIYFEVHGSSSTNAGTRLIPYALGTSIGSLGSGILMRTTGKYWWLTVAAESTFILGCALIWGFLNEDSPVWPPFIFLTLIGIGYGAVLTTTLLSLISAVDHKHQAVVTSISYAFRSTGSTIGIAIAGAVLQNVLKAQLESRFGNQPGAADEIRRIRGNLDEVRRLPPGWQDGVMAAYAQAFNAVWGVATASAIIGGVIGLFMREHILHSSLDRK